MANPNTSDKAEMDNNEAIAAPKPLLASSLSFKVVGIGASAGGLEALELFLKATPENTNMAYVIIQHLDPTHVGMMPELLQRLTTMKVFQATDSLEVKPNEVYVIPPNKSLSILNGKLHLFEPIEIKGLRLPIDLFFRSLADDMGEQSIGIILSGMGSDGSLGIKAIKEKNGLVLVQDPTSAKFSGMPQNAIDSTYADVIAPAHELPQRLINLIKLIPSTKSDDSVDIKTKSSLEKIFILLRNQTGHDFSQYKNTTLIRRIERRKVVHQLDSLPNYVRFLQENPKEIDILFKELLIGVTSFFRDPLVWEKLKTSIFPNLIEDLPDGYTMRAWVVGCSSGEEAFSLAIIFKEMMETLKFTRKISLLIFATDIDKDAIEKARKGLFPLNIAADVQPDLLNKYFREETEGYRVNTAIREMVVFAPQNVTKDPPFTKLDILSCRNMLIYMEPQLQKKIITLFNYSLNTNGVLLLGSAETLGANNEGYDVLDNNLKFFKKSIHAPVRPIDLSTPIYSDSPPEKAPIDRLKAIGNLQTLTDQFLLKHFVPSSILINDKGDILYITGHAGKYLEPASGKANWNIHAMVKEDLQRELPSALRKTRLNFDPLILKNIKVNTNEGLKLVDISLQRINSTDSLRDSVIIVFTENPEKIKEADFRKGKKGTEPENLELIALELELKRTSEDLQNTRIEMQTSQEELKSSNEELQSTNEELQSSNEELTTSKEEMQSLNEELQTVNNELQSRLTDFELANNDMENLLNSTEIATLFLDKNLNIRRFTETINPIFNMRKGDIGRPFTELVSELNYPELDQNAKQVLKTLAPIESSNTSKSGSWFKTRIMPYRTHDDKVEGVVITFANITASKQLELALKESNEALKVNEQRIIVSETNYRRLFESAKDGILILDANTGTITDVNPFLIDLLGYSKSEFVEKKIWDIGFFRDIVANKEKFAELQQKEMVRYENLPLETAQGKKINVEFVSNVYEVNSHKVIQCNVRNITDRKKAEEQMFISETRFRRLFESAKDGILILDAETGKIIDVNPYLEALLGYSKTELLEKTIWEIGIFVDIATNKEKFAELQKKDMLRFDNLPLETSSGEKICVEFVSILYMENSHEVVQCIIRDITARKREEALLLISENRYRRLFESAMDGILILDVNSGKIIDINPYLVELLGKTKPALLEKPIWEVNVFNEIIDSKEKYLEFIDKKTVHYDNLLLETDRKGRINVEFMAILYKQDNDEVVQCTVRNITERKLVESLLQISEIRYRRLFESAKDGIIILDADTGKILDVNPYLIDLLGYSKAEFVEKSIWEIGLFKDIIQNREKFAELRQKQMLRYENLPLETASGERINVEFISNVYEESNVKVVLCTIRNITDRKKIEEALQESESKFKSFFNKSPFAISFQQMRYDNAGNAVDYLFIDANRIFVDLIGTNPVGKTATEIFPNIAKGPFDWLGNFAKVAKNGDNIHLQEPFPGINGQNECIAYSYKPDYFVTAFLDISKPDKN